MSGAAKRSRLWELGILLVSALTAGLLACGGATAATDTAGSTSAERLVLDALRAEAAGDAARHDALLDEAIHATPDNKLAHWCRGEVQVNSKWLPVDEAQRAAAADPRRIEYLSLRATYGNQPDAQLDLARWCRRNNLNDEARIHWANVLSFQPNNEEALRALGTDWFAGRLMTYAQIDAAKRDIREARQAAKQSKPRVARWQRMLSAGDIASRDAALDEIRSLTATDAISAIEEVTLDDDIETTAEQERCRHFSLAFVEALAGMPDPAAAASLARHAVLSPISDVRQAAMERLKERPMQDYVPLLLDALAMPIESTFQVTTDPDGSVHYRHSLYVDGRQGDWSLENERTAWLLDRRGPEPVRNVGAGRGANQRLSQTDTQSVLQAVGKVAQSRQQYAAEAVAVEQQVAQRNEAAAAFNKRLIPVLAQTSGEDLGANPQDWWNWWQRYNEYDSSGGEPVYERRNSESTYQYRYGRPQGSCFPRGTLVWTNTGKRAIETIEIGDLVLSQNVNTGQLAYQPVVGRTVRPPSPILKMTLGSQELRTTLGHPLWVSGVGWRMAKEVGEAAILHGVRGPVRVDAVEPDGESEAFNLVVAEFNTYFVGDSGILVHDNTPREPTAAVVPGLVPE